MKSDNIMNDLRILTFIPVSIVGIVFIFFLFNSIQQFDKLQTLQKNNSKIEKISILVMHLQQERGLSSGYLGSKGTKFSTQLAKVKKKLTMTTKN